MLKSYASAFSKLQVQLLIRALDSGGKAYPVIPKPEHSFAVTQEDRDKVEKLLSDAEPLCQELGLASPCRHIAWVRKGARAWTYDSIGHHIDELRRRIEDELDSRKFLYVPTDKIAYYNREELFGPLVAKRFPSACDDVAEAGNCFALGRWTATVHQCIGIMQIGLIALARHLKQRIDIHVDDWGQIIDKVKSGSEAKLNAMPRPRRKKLEPFYNEILLDLGGVKTAWRHPDAHFRRSFNEDQARKVLEKVRDFMQNLATRIRER